MAHFSSFHFILHLLVLHFIAFLPKGTVTLEIHDCTKGQGNYTNNSTYQENLNNLLASIYTNTQINYGFYNTSTGENSDRVYVIALCRPDRSPETCRACIRNSSDALLTRCPNFKEAMGGLDDCIIRYSPRYIFNHMETGPYFWAYSLNNASDTRGFNESRATLLDQLGDEAAGGDSRYKYSMGQIGAPESKNIYALVQCTPDISGSECRNCLHEAQGLIPECCPNRSGGRVITPSCNFRYEIDPFYSRLISPTPSPSDSKVANSSAPSPVNRLWVIVMLCFVHVATHF